MFNFFTTLFAGITLSIQALFGIHSVPASLSVSATTTESASTTQQASMPSVTHSGSTQGITTSPKTTTQLQTNIKTETPTQTVTATPTVTASTVGTNNAAHFGSIDPSSLAATTPTPTITGSSNALYVQLLGTYPADPLTGSMISSQAIPVENGRWSFSVTSSPGAFGSTSLCNGTYSLELDGIYSTTTPIINATLENTTFTVNAPGNPNVCTPPTHL